MKKLILAVITFLFLASSASAYVLDAWQLDLSQLDAGLTKASNIDRIGFQGSATIHQSLGGNNILDDGDTFSESSVFWSLEYVPEPGTGSNIAFDLDANNDGTQDRWLYFYADDLTGSVYDVNGTNFKYMFDAGQTISLFYDTDAVVGGGTAIATLEILNPSGGNAPDYLGGAGATGTTQVTGLFTSAYDDLFLTKEGYDFAAMIANGIFPKGYLDVQNTVMSMTPGNNELIFEVRSSGIFNTEVPEPTTMVLLGMGLLGLAGIGRKRLS